MSLKAVHFYGLSNCHRRSQVCERHICVRMTTLQEHTIHYTRTIRMTRTSIYTKLLELVAILIIVIVNVSSEQCPVQCECNEYDVVLCSNGGLTTIPGVLANSTRVLSIVGDNRPNLIPTLSEEMLYLLHIPNIQELDITHSGIKIVYNFTFRALKKLTRINLSYNDIAEVSRNTFAGLNQLIELDISFNRITNLPDGTFYNIQNLRNFNFANNMLNHELVPTLFHSLDELQSLTLNNNQLFSVRFLLSRLVSLRNLHMKNCSIRFLPHDLLPQTKVLEIVHLEDNSFVNIPKQFFHNRENIKYIYLDGNQIENLMPEHFAGLALQVLSLRRTLKSDTGLHPLVFQNTTIKHLDIGKNNLSNLSKIHDVLSENSIRDSIEVLSLSGNPIQSIDNLQLHQFVRLKHLKLSNTLLDRISADFIQNLLQTKLESLDISNCMITSIQQEVVDAINSSSIHFNLTFNPWRCDCELKSLVDWLKQGQMSGCLIRGVNRCTCAEPSHLLGQNITSVDLDTCPAQGAIDDSIQTGILIFSVILVVIIVIGLVLLIRRRRASSTQVEGGSRFCDTSEVIVNRNATIKNGNAGNPYGHIDFDQTDSNLGQVHINPGYKDNEIIPLDEEMRVIGVRPAYLFSNGHKPKSTVAKSENSERANDTINNEQNTSPNTAYRTKPDNTVNNVNNDSFEFTNYGADIDDENTFTEYSSPGEDHQKYNDNTDDIFIITNSYMETEI